MSTKERQVVGELQIIHLGVEAFGRAHHFAVGFRIEGIEVRHATVHVEVDDALSGRDLLGGRGSRTGGAPEVGEGREGADAKEGLRGSADEVTAGEVEILFHGGQERVGGSDEESRGGRDGGDHWMKRNWRVLSTVQTMPMTVPDSASAAQASRKMAFSSSAGRRLSMVR